MGVERSRTTLSVQAARFKTFALLTCWGKGFAGGCNEWSYTGQFAGIKAVEWGVGLFSEERSYPGQIAGVEALKGVVRSVVTPAKLLRSRHCRGVARIVVTPAKLFRSRLCRG